MLFQTLKNTGIKDNPGKNCFVLLNITRELHLDDCMSLAFDGQDGNELQFETMQPTYRRPLPVRKNRGERANFFKSIRRAPVLLKNDKTRSCFVFLLIQSFDTFLQSSEYEKRDSGTHQDSLQASLPLPYPFPYPWGLRESLLVGYP